MGVAPLDDADTMRIDVLDLGSNSFHLLSAWCAGGKFSELTSVGIPVRIGERAFDRGMIDDDAWTRGLAAISALVTGSDCRPIAVATGIFRDALNGRDMIDEASRRFGLPIAILPGEEEARLTYVGVRHETHDPEGAIAVFDLGGGSLECALGDHGQATIAASLPLGTLRLASLHDTDVRATVCDIAGPVVRAICRRNPDEVVLSSGSARALLRIARRLGAREQVKNCLAAKTVSRVAFELASLPAHELPLLGISDARCATIARAARILATVVELTGAPLVRFARGALREGIVRESAAAREWGARGRARKVA